MTKKQKMILWIIGGVLAIAFFTTIIFTGKTVYKLNDTFQKTYEPITKSPIEQKEAVEKLEQAKKITVLLLGTDQRANEPARSDTIIFMTIDPVKKETKMVSIPRDTYAEIVGRGTMDKINHAHAFGGVAMSVASVEKFMNHPIDFYVRTNMRGFAKAVGILGGVEVTNKFAFTSANQTFPTGEITLTEENVLAYVRMRKGDPEGDFGRQRRQREVIQALATQGREFNSLLNIDAYLSILGDNVKTNVPPNQMYSFIKTYGPLLQETKTYQLKGKGVIRNKIWYWDVDEASRQEVVSQFK